MSFALDRLIERELARLGGPAGCSCAACRMARWVDEPPPHRPARRATRSDTGGAAMSRWRGWTSAASLAELQRAWADRYVTPIAAALRPFFRTGAPNLYRLTRRGIDRERPLTIGMTQDAKSILQRVREQHGDIAGGDPKVKARIQGLPDDRVLVQAGRLAGAPDVGDAHAYEIWLQVREHPHLCEPDTGAFDEHL
jgi:hypothetical protein